MTFGTSGPKKNGFPGLHPDLPKPSADAQILQGGTNEILFANGDPSGNEAKIGSIERLFQNGPQPNRIVRRVKVSHLRNTESL